MSEIAINGKHRKIPYLVLLIRLVTKVSGQSLAESLGGFYTSITLVFKVPYLTLPYLGYRTVNVFYFQTSTL